VEPPLYRCCFDNTGSPESVYETFTDLNDPKKGELVHKIFMDKVLSDTNQGAPSQGDSCAFPFFENVGVPLMATLYILGLNVGLPGLIIFMSPISLLVDPQALVIVILCR
jgi:hypothetical protein